MPSFIASTRPARRIVAALLALSVILTSLGWSHPACEQMGDASDGIAMVAGHADMASTHAATPGAGGDAGHHADHCSGHGRHSAPDEGGCAMVAHCSAATVATAAAVSVPERLALAQPALPAATRQLDRANQPEAPPPRA